MCACWWSRRMASLIPNLVTLCSWVVNFHALVTLPWAKNSGTNCMGGCEGPISLWTFVVEYFAVAGIRTQDCPARIPVTTLTILSIEICIKLNESHYRPGNAPRFPGVWGSQISRQSAHEGVSLSALSTGRLYPRNYFWYSFVLGWVNPKGQSATGRIMSLKISNDTIGNQTRELPVCSTVSYSTAPQRDTYNVVKFFTDWKLSCLQIGFKKFSQTHSDISLSKVRHVEVQFQKVTLALRQGCRGDKIFVLSLLVTNASQWLKNYSPRSVLKCK
jgi:hypothetical protein